MGISKSFYEVDRQYLHEIIPLAQPLSINLEVSSCCNIKCKYCIHSNFFDNNRAPLLSHNMSINEFKNIIYQLKQFPNKLKKLVINGVGEPLCNPHFTDLLTIAKQANVAEKIEFFTNGTLLSPALSQAIIASKVDRIKISLQGLTTQKYQEVCNTQIDFDKFVNNISYLNSIKGNTEVFIKIINIGLDSKEDEKQFYKKFSFANRLFIESVQPWFANVDYSYLNSSNNSDIEKKNKYGEIISVPKICSIPFYRLYIDVSGNVYYCYSIRPSSFVFNCFEKTLLEIWNSPKRLSFLRNMLQLGRQCNPECCHCTMMCDAAFSQQDNLDAHKDKLLQRFQ